MTNRIYLSTSASALEGGCGSEDTAESEYRTRVLRDVFSFAKEGSRKIRGRGRNKSGLVLNWILNKVLRLFANTKPKHI